MVKKRYPVPERLLGFYEGLAGDDARLHFCRCVDIKPAYMSHILSGFRRAGVDLAYRIVHELRERNIDLCLEDVIPCDYFTEDEKKVA